jgi:thiol:disulfide interchange protein DsbG
MWTFAALFIVFPHLCAAQGIPERPHCTIDPLKPFLVADRGEEASGATKRDQEPLASDIPAATSGLDGAGKSGLAREPGSDVPVLAHIAATGAKIVDLGNSHGLRMVLARQGEEFMLFQVAPDGEAVVAGLQAELPAAKLLAAVEGRATEIGTAHGLRGLFLRNGKHFQVLYVTPDGESVIPGVMWDAAGKNVTREQIAPVSGAVPTVVIGKDAAAEKKPPLEAVKETSFGTIGRGSAPRLWVFVDPLCGYSVRALQGVKPFAASGQVEVAFVPVAILDNGHGRSTASALSMLSRPGDEMIDAWEKGELSATAGPAAEMRLQKNMAVAEAIGLRGTPLILWRKADGSEGRLDGLPSDWKAIIDSMGGEAHADAR